jgi:ubiquinone/menaquinone biosynthesis C-methylase UbiE
LIYPTNDSSGQEYNNHGLYLQIGDVENIPWPDNEFDLLTCNASFLHFPDPMQSLNEMNRVLKAKGRLVIADPWWPGKVRQGINYYLKSPFNLSGDVRIYSQHEMEKLLDAGGIPFYRMGTDRPNLLHYNCFH